MELRAGFSTMSMSGHSKVKKIPGLPPEDHRLVYYYVVYPNFLLSPHPDYVLAHTLWPLSENRTREIFISSPRVRARSRQNRFARSSLVRWRS